MTTQGFTHLDEHGHARMVDVNHKKITSRRAVARGVVSADEEAVSKLSVDDQLAARIAGEQAAMNTHLLVPLCHPIPVESVEVVIDVQANGVVAVESTALATWKTGVEIEAMTATSIAALTLVRALEMHGAVARIDDIAVWSKEGGKSGSWGRRPEL